MRRREFLGVLGGAVVWPRAARAQPAAMPVVGYLGASLRSPNEAVIAVLRQTAEAGYVDGRNVRIEYHFAEGRYDRLPAMAAELARRQVAVLVAMPTVAALAAKAATTTISDRIQHDRRSDQARPGRQPGAARRQRDRRLLLSLRPGRKTAEAAARAGASRGAHRSAG